MTGQCNDFADFLVCLSRALGAVGVSCQRSTDVASMVYGIPTPKLVTTPITPAPRLPPYPATSQSWLYHQWASSDGSVWDGCLRVNGILTPDDWTLGEYRTRLASPAPPSEGNYWAPITPFLATIVAGP